MSFHLRKQKNGVADFLGKQRWPRSDKLGFRYRIPGMGIITMRQGDTLLTRSRIPVAQFGEVVALPADTGSGDSQYSIKLFTELGAMKNIQIHSTGVELSTIEAAKSAAEAIASVAAAREAEKEAEREAASEVAQLEKDVKLLKLKKEKKELEHALGL